MPGQGYCLRTRTWVAAPEPQRCFRAALHGLPSTCLRAGPWALLLRAVGPTLGLDPASVALARPTCYAPLLGYPRTPCVPLHRPEQPLYVFWWVNSGLV